MRHQRFDAWAPFGENGYKSPRRWLTFRLHILFSSLGVGDLATGFAFALPKGAFASGGWFRVATLILSADFSAGIWINGLAARPLRPLKGSGMEDTWAFLSRHAETCYQCEPFHAGD